MADEDVNNNNNNNAIDVNEEADPDFQYHPGDSTTCIVVQNRTTGSNVFFEWRRHPRCNLHPFDPPSTPISSSRGLLLCHERFPSTSISTYYVGNPFQETPYNTFRPLQPHQSDTHAVLAATPDGFFLIVCLLPHHTLEGNIYYAIEAYSSSHGHWLTLSSKFHILHYDMDRVVIPNSGVSCRRFAYWLTWLASSRSRVMVVRVDTKSSDDPVKYPLLTYLGIPPCLPKWNDGVVRMKLGRVGNKVGLSVVNDRRTRVELFILKEMGSENGNEEDDDAKMVGWRQYPGCLKVEVDPTVEEGVVKIVEPNRIKCREMPEAIRFESNKMEVLVSVGGGRRVVLWESRRSNTLRTRVAVMRSEVLAVAAPYLVDCGVPHVTTCVLPNNATCDCEMYKPVYK